MAGESDKGNCANSLGETQFGGLFGGGKVCKRVCLDGSSRHLCAQMDAFGLRICTHSEFV